MNTIAPNESYEMGVDLSAIGFTGCISTFIPHTRSSQSFTSTLKDFAVIPFNTCKPHIEVTKTCSAVVNTAATGVSVTITGTVTNDGNVPLTGITLTDVPTATFDTFSNGQTNGSATLDPGNSFDYTGHYTSRSCTLNDTVTVTATSTAGGVSKTATAMASASCTATIHPRIRVTKCCQNHLVADSSGHLVQQVDFKGQVCAKDSSGTNSDVQLTGVTLTDNKGGVTTAPSATLNPGACSPYSGKYFPTATETNTCTESDIVRATSGTAICAGSADSGQVTATCSLCPPSSPCP